MKYLKFIIISNLLVLSNTLNAQSSKIDSVSYGIGLTFSGQLKMIKKRLNLTETKLNEKAYFLGFNNVIDEENLKITTEKEDALMLRFSKLEGDLVREKKKSTNLNISKGASLKTLMDSVSYALGVKFSTNIKKDIKSIEKDLQFKVNIKKLKLGYTQGEHTRKMKIYKKTITAFKQEKKRLIYKENKSEGEKFLEKNKTKKGVKTTASGLQYLVIKEGKGEKPVATSNVKVHYHGTLINGIVFDSSVNRKEPATFPLNRVIKGWTEGVRLMTPGSKYKFFLPYTLAYGEQGSGPKIKPYSTLIFEVELLEVVKDK